MILAVFLEQHISFVKVSNEDKIFFISQSIHLNNYKYGSFNKEHLRFSPIWESDYKEIIKNLEHHEITSLDKDYILNKFPEHFI